MTTQTMTWMALGVYFLITVFFTVRGMLKTSSLENYAVGSGHISPVLIGLSLSVQLTSVATFVVNPGLVYKYGVAGLLGYGVAAALGVTVGLIVFSFKFRSVGSQVKALTVPQWIGAKYGSKGLRIFFSILSMGMIAFAVLIVVAISLVLSNLVQISPNTIVYGITLFVFSYIMLGGTNTHVYTNMIQSVIMLIVAVILIKSGLPSFLSGELFTRLKEIDMNLVSIVNPASLYFRNLFEVFFCNFFVGIAIVCQPHIMGKALCLKCDKDVVKCLIVAALAGTVFASVMLVGLYARVSLTTEVPADYVVASYIVTMFSPVIQVLIGIGILCAGLSTLEGILLVISAILSNDIYMPLLADKSKPIAEQGKKALTFGRIGLVIVAILTVFLSKMQIANPTGGSVVIFAQYGIYFLFTASFFPLASGMFSEKITKNVVISAIVTSIAAYLLISYFKITSMHNNPGFLATSGLIVGTVVTFLGTVIHSSSSSEEKVSANS